jgi:hypothetical protein
MHVLGKHPSLFHHYQTIHWHIELTGKQVPSQVDIIPSWTAHSKKTQLPKLVTARGLPSAQGYRIIATYLLCLFKSAFQNAVLPQNEGSKKCALGWDCSLQIVRSQASTFQNTTYDTSQFRYFCSQGLMREGHQATRWVKGFGRFVANARLQSKGWECKEGPTSL